MENPTSFDLNLAIQRWRENLAQSPAFRSENLNELETHVRDSMAALQARGLSDDEAFLVATRRVGGSGTLEQEFGKVNGQAVWLDRLLWMLIGWQVLGFVSGMAGLFTQNVVFFGLNSLRFNFAANGPGIPVFLLCLAQLSAFAGSLAFCWWLISRKGRNFGDWAGTFLRGRGTLIVAFVLLFMLSLSTMAIAFGMEIIRAKVASPASFGHYLISRQFSMFIMLVIQTATLVALTLFLARKRLRTSQA